MPDWYSRYVVSWEVSTTLEVEFCLSSLERALATSEPEILNSDQGTQFTSDDFTGRLENAGVAISMDGRGRFYDNIVQSSIALAESSDSAIIERLWRTVKYEEVYLRDYGSMTEAIDCLGAYFAFYNFKRFHQSLGYETPASVYFGQQCETDQARSHNLVSSPAMAGELLAVGTAGG